MVILLALMYLWGIVLFATFLMTRRFLRRQQGNAVSKTEKYLYSLNVASFGWLFTIIFMLSFMEFLVVVIVPMQIWSSFVEFLNDALSFSIFSVLMFTLLTIGFLVGGYNHNPRASYVPVNAVSKLWLWVLIVLFTVLGIVGILTGILV